MSTVSKVHTFYKGLNKDLNTNNISNEHLTDALNATLMSDNTDQYAFTNEKGTTKICDLPNSTLIGRYVLEKEVVLFFTDGITHEIGVVSEGIYRSYVVNNTLAQTVVTFNTENLTYSTWSSTDNLNFNVENPIKIRWRKAFNSNRIIYFVDGLNTPKTINLDRLPSPTSINPTPSILDAFNLFESKLLPTIEYTGQLDYGMLEVGTYQFMVQYLDDNLGESLFSVATNPIPVVAATRSAGRYQYVGATRGTNASKSIVLTLNNVDLDFKYVQLIVVRYSGPGDTLIAEVVERKEITSTTMEFVYGSVSTSLKTIDLTSIVTELPGYISANCIQDKDNVLTLGDLKTLPVQNLQQLVNKLNLKYRVKEVPYNDVVKTSRQVGNTLTDVFEISSINVLEAQSDTINIVMTKQVVLPSVNNVALIKVVVTNEINPALPHTVTYTRITPTSITVDGPAIRATFSGNDFTDDTLFNFEDLTVLNTADPNHVPMYFIALGTEVDTPAGGVAGAAILATTGDNYSYISDIYTGQTSVASMSAADPSDVVLSSGISTIEISDEIAIYGKAQTTQTDGLFLVTEVSSSTNIKVDVNTVVAETVGGPVFTAIDRFGVEIIPTGSTSTTTGTNYLTNNAYFEDYADEKIASEYKSRKRGEAYSFAIRFRYGNGGVTPFFHIPGNNRAALYDTVNPDNNRLNSIPDIGAVEDRKNNSTGILGTYVSNSIYTTGKSYPTDSGTGSDYSNGSNVRHHIMPTLNEEPLLRFEEDNKQYYLRILGVYPTYTDSLGFEKTIEEFITEFSSQFTGIVGYEFGVQSRLDLGNKSILCQGIAQPLQFVNGSGPRGGIRGNNSAFAGRTKVYTGTRTRSYLDSSDTDTGHISESYNQDITFLCQFYSPDTLLLNKTIPAGAKIKPVTGIKGDVSTVARSTPSPDKKLSDTRSGILHMFYNYNDYFQTYDLELKPTDTGSNTLLGGLIGYNKLSSPYISPVRINGAYNLVGTDNIYGNVQIPTYPSLAIRNYLNEGYLCLDLGSSNSLPLLVQSDPNDFTISIATSRASGGTLSNSEYNISSNINYSTQYYHTKQNSRLIYDIVLDVINQYGDVSGAKYTVCGVYSIGQGNTFENSTFYDGDIFLSKCSFRNSFGFPTEVRYNNKSYTKMTSARETGVDYAIGEEWNTLFYCWFESEVNCNYRHIGVNGNNVALQPCFPANPSITQVVMSTGGMFPWLASVNRPIIPIHLGNKNSYDRGGVLDTPFNISESNQYNSLYSKEDIINVGFSLPLAFEDVNEFPNRIIYSAVAVEGEQKDSYKVFLANNYHDIPKDKGKIEMMFVQGGTYYVHTKYTLYKTFFNESVSLPTSTEEIYLGNGGIFSRPSIELLDIDGGYAGCQSVWSSVDTPFGRFFIDTNQSKLFLLAGGSIQQVNSGINRFLQNELNIPNYIDNPFMFKGLVAAYDYNFDRLIITKHNTENASKSFTLSYYPQIKNFFSYHSYTPNCMFTYKGDIKMYWNGLKEMHELGTGEYGVYFNNRYNTEIEVVTNNNVTETAYDNLIVKSIITDEAAQAVKHYDFFDEYTVKNDACNSDIIPLTKDVTYKFKRDGFTLAYPRNAVINPFINVNEPTNLDKTRKFLPRITGKYARTRFIYKNLNNYKLTVNYIVSLFRPIAR